MAANSFRAQHGAQTQIVSNAIFTIGELDPNIDLNIINIDTERSEVVRTPRKYSISNIVFFTQVT